MTPSQPSKVSSSTTLLRQCEPLFQYLCLLNQLGRGKATSRDVPGAVEVRKELHRLFAKIRKDADEQVYSDTTERSLWALADGIVSESQLPWVWEKKGFSPDGAEYNALDEEFWENTRFTMSQRESEVQLQQLEVYAACIGLGYDWMYRINPNYPSVMKEIWSAVGSRFDPGEKRRLTAEAYNELNEDKLAWDKRAVVARYVVLLIVTLVVVLAGQIYMYRSATRDIGDSLKTIDRAVAAPPTASAGERSQ